MAKPKTIEDDVLINLIQKFYTEECYSNAAGLKLPRIAEYIAKNGYPTYTVTTLRRNTNARNYIDSLIESSTGNANILVTYKTLDVDTFLDNNRTRTALKRELTNLDAYYKSIADSASEISKKNRELSEKFQRTKTALTDVQAEAASLKQTIARLEQENKALKLQNKNLSDTVKDYVYDGIATELLVQDGELINADTKIDPEKLKNNIISAGTSIISETKPAPAIRSGSNVLKGIFEDFED